MSQKRKKGFRARVVLVVALVFLAYVLNASFVLAVVTIPDSNALSFGDGSNDNPFSITAWVKIDDVVTHNSIVTKFGSVGSREWVFSFRDNKKIWFFTEDASNEARQRIESVQTTPMNQWVFLTVTYDGREGSNAANGMTLYENGVVKATTATTDASYVAMENTNQNIVIGALGTLGEPMEGQIDDVDIYKRVLTAAEISYLHLLLGPQPVDAGASCPVGYSAIGSDWYDDNPSYNPGMDVVCNWEGVDDYADDDNNCGTIDCDGLNNYVQSGTESTTTTETCTFNDYADLTANRCEGYDDCKDANSADCGSSPSASTPYTCGACKYIAASSCTGLTKGSCTNYASGTACTGDNFKCDGSGNCACIPRHGDWIGWTEPAPEDSNTVLLLHFDGNNDDSSAGGATHTATERGRTVTTALSKFGTGSSVATIDNSDLRITTGTSDWAFGSADFTVDFWFNWDGTSQLNTYGVGMGSYDGENKDSWLLQIYDSGRIMYYVFDSAGNRFIEGSNSGLFTANNWHHFAWVYGTGVMKLYLDGTVVASRTLTLDIGGTKDLWVGNVNPNNPESGFHGHIDEVRISKGVARWTSDFTPPTSAYGRICSAACGSGTIKRTRTCTNPSPNLCGNACAGDDSDYGGGVCDVGTSACGWSSYGAFSGWSTSCGSGATRSQTRTCSTGAAGSGHCSGSATNTETSDQGSSTCGWSDYGAFSGWSTSCGSATKSQTRTCSTGAAGSGHCSGSATNTETAEQGSNTCGWSGYGGFSGWSTSCGSATRSQTRTCSTGAAGSTHCSGSATNTETADQGSSTCGWSSYGGWSGCSVGCGSGSQSSSRSCNVAGHCSGSSSRSQGCSAGSSTCGWGGWGGWSGCSVSCGGGTETRTRGCNVGGKCSGSSSESRSGCNSQACYTPPPAKCCGYPCSSLNKPNNANVRYADMTSSCNAYCGAGGTGSWSCSYHRTLPFNSFNGKTITWATCSQGGGGEGPPNQACVISYRQDCDSYDCWTVGSTATCSCS